MNNKFFRKMKIKLKIFLKIIFYKIFVNLQKFGLDILPRHFYSEIPNIKFLKNSNNWKLPFNMKYIKGSSISSQINNMKSIMKPDMVEELSNRKIWTEACKKTGEIGFGKIEAEFLYAFIVKHKPKQIYQIGCGVSTEICLQASKKISSKIDIVCIEPFPSDFLKSKKRSGEINLIEEKLQDIDKKFIHEKISNLKRNSLFFVDSSHALGPSGEVSRIILELLPLLPKETYIHFHDIQFPYDYSRSILKSSLFFQHESILLQSFLTLNDKFRIHCSLSMMHYLAQKDLQKKFLNYKPQESKYGLSISDYGDFPSSTYLYKEL